MTKFKSGDILEPKVSREKREMKKWYFLCVRFQYGWAVIAGEMDIEKVKQAHKDNYSHEDYVILEVELPT